MEIISIFLISVCSPLSGSWHIELHDELKNWVKSYISIKKNYNKCFLWCHMKQLNPLNKNPQQITTEVKNKC